MLQIAAQAHLRQCRCRDKAGEPWPLWSTRAEDLQAISTRSLEPTAPIADRAYSSYIYLIYHILWPTHPIGPKYLYTMAYRTDILYHSLSLKAIPTPYCFFRSTARASRCSSSSPSS